MITGYNKAVALKHAVEEEIIQITASALQMPPNAVIVCNDDTTNEFKLWAVKYFKDIEKK